MTSLNVRPAKCEPMPSFMRPRSIESLTSSDFMAHKADVMSEMKIASRVESAA